MRIRAFWQGCADLLIQERQGPADRAEMEVETRAARKVLRLCTDLLVWTWPPYWMCRALERTA
eukprot:5124767-Pleurochrysis_carterae.AAC.1